MRKFVEMLPPLLALFSIALIASRGDITEALEVTIISGIFLGGCGWVIKSLLTWKKNRPSLILEIRNMDNPHYPEEGDPKVNVLCLRLSFTSDFISFAGPFAIRDNNGKSLDWRLPDPEDWNGSFDKDESPVRIYLESLAFEQDSKTIQATSYFEKMRFKVKSNKLTCETLLSLDVDGVRRKKAGEKEDVFPWDEPIV